MKKIKLMPVDNGNISQEQLVEFLNQVNKENNHFISEDINLSNYVEKLIKYAIIYVLVKNKNVIGMVAFYANDMLKKTAFISSIGIKKEFTGQSLGVNLLLKACKISKERMMTNIYLQVHKENLIAIAFYKKNGFNIINESEKKFKMVKQL